MKNRANDHSKYKDWIDPNEVIPYERNAKKHDDKQVRNIANSIRRFGWQQDTVITSDNVLVIGHGRRLAALKLGCMMPYHRAFDAVGALAFVVYGYLTKTWSTLALNAVLIGIQAWKLLAIKKRGH